MTTPPSPTHVLLYVLVAGGLTIAASLVSPEATIGVGTLLAMGGGYFFVKGKVEEGVKKAEVVAAKTEEVAAKTDEQTKVLTRIDYNTNGVLTNRLRLLEMQVVAIGERVAQHDTKLTAIHDLLDDRLPPKGD